MISRLRGLLIEKQPPFLLLEVGGLTYELQASMNTFYRLPELNSEVILHTHFIVREDGHFLFGFGELRERALFQTLLKVNGIGPKVALAILSSIEPDAFVQCVAEQNATALQRLPGVGKKTAERLIIEMRDRLADWGSEEGVAITLNNQTPLGVIAKKPEQDAISALIALGYKPQEASRAITQIADKTLPSEQLIRLALRNMNQ